MISTEKLTLLFGGVSAEQVARVFAVTFVSSLAAGSLGSTVALWRAPDRSMSAAG